MTSLARILVVDDELCSRETVAALLAKDGYELDFATSGTEALARLRTPDVDLVLCDVIMRGMDGLEICRLIKANPLWRTIPVILVTALDGQDDMIRGLDAGADEFVTKPVDRIVLRARIRVLLRIRAQFRELGERHDTLERLLAKRVASVAAEAGLTDREREVLDLLLLGRTHEEIGIALDISPRTAKYHQANVLEKLGAESRAELLRLML